MYVNFKLFIKGVMVNPFLKQQLLRKRQPVIPNSLREGILTNQASQGHFVSHALHLVKMGQSTFLLLFCNIATKTILVRSSESKLSRLSLLPLPIESHQDPTPNSQPLHLALPIPS